MAGVGVRFISLGQFGLGSRVSLGMGLDMSFGV